MTHSRIVGAICVWFAALPLARAQMPATVPAEFHRGELVTYPGAWGFHLGKSCIILVSDEQLRALEDPDRKIDISVTFASHQKSLREICQQGQAAGHRTLILAFDQFFSQYRPGQGDKPRELTPDSPEYIRRIAAISQFAQQYGMALELSLLSPLEIGPGYTHDTGESGTWMHFRKGVRDPQNGDYSVQLWRQQLWTNNKGPVALKDAGVRVFAFKERRIAGTHYYLVNPSDIIDISDTAKTDLWSGSVQSNHTVRVNVHGQGGPQGYDRVMVVQCYQTPEMDYFSDTSLPYLKTLLDRYVDAGVRLNALYSDELHIQQDWDYFHHHDHGQFALRYVSAGLAKQFARQYGPQYTDFAKYLVYFLHGQEDTAVDLTAKADGMYVFGDSPEAIRATALFRAHYYHLLQDGVTDLFVNAKRYLEGRLGHRLEARAHATWAESPTIDAWDTGAEPLPPHQYEYTSNFVWSNTVQQASAACADYFKWGDFLTGNGNDHAEGGWLDRNYCGLALACSTGILNDIPNSYAAHWGMPDAIYRRRYSLANAYGTTAEPRFAMVQNMEHRDSSVLMLYPLDLVAADERFGSWMTQYGYANYVTPAKLLERGQVVNGAIEMAGRRFTTLVALFEPFPPVALLEMMEQLSQTGGRVIWSGPPPLLCADGTPGLAKWQELTGVHYSPTHNEGRAVPGQQITFEGLLEKLAPMTVLTDFTVDHVYALSPQAGVQTIARTKQLAVGTHRTTAGNGSVTVLGFRPRDDQAASLGYEARWWFEILDTLGAYPPTGKWADFNDNTEHLSRTTDWLTCRFPNGAIAVAPHLRNLEECWPAGFARNAEEDAKLVKTLTLPSEAISIQDFRVNGHRVSYDGQHCVTFRMDNRNRLLAFSGHHCRGITVDGIATTFSENPLSLVAWAPVEPNCRVPDGATMRLLVHGTGEVRIPLFDAPAEFELVTEGTIPGNRGTAIPHRVENNSLVFLIDQSLGRWLYVVPRCAS